jgi:pyridoxamine 5'-phosphate oxidase
MKEPLPEPLPVDPLPLMEAWIGEAATAVKTATAMALATVDADGNPAARMVICRGFDVKAGWLVFYTDRGSAKGHALAARPRASVVFHWDVFERQIRVDGPVSWAPESDSDRYWNTRPVDARVAAIASDQSQPIESRAAFLEKVEAVARGASADIPRPARWGGYRIWAERVELWVGQPGRAHDRAVWTRALTPAADGFSGGAWTGTRLQP